MKRLTQFLLATMSMVVVIGWPSPVAAQCSDGLPAGCMTRTTWAANVSETDTAVRVTSATGFTVGNFIWSDFEQMAIQAVSGTTITVRRGVNGTAAQAHDSGDSALTGGAQYFHTNDPDLGQDCTRGVGQAAYSPWINVRSGWISVCDNGVTADWSQTRKFQQTPNSEPTSF